MKWTLVAVVSILLGGCSSLPPILQRWAGLQIATTTLLRADSKAGESLDFSEDGLVRVHSKVSDAPAVAWRVRGEWLEIDTTNDGTFQTRMRALTATNGRIVAEGPTGKKSVWSEETVKIVIKPLPPKPGFWLP